MKTRIQLNLVRKRPSKRDRARSDEAFMQWQKNVFRPISPIPIQETKCEAAVRVAQDFLTRCRLFDAAGLRFKTADGYEDIWRIQKLAESRLAEAIRDLRFERGDY